MKGYVNGIDWINAESMRYWSHPSSVSAERRKQEIKNAIFSGEVLGARKIDGYYERLIKDEDGNCFMVARSKNVHGEATEKLAWVPQIHDAMAAMPNGTVLLSECWLPGDEGSKKITSLLGCLKDKCIARQEKGQKLHFYIFDVMAYRGESFTQTPFEEIVPHSNHICKIDCLVSVCNRHKRRTGNYRQNHRMEPHSDHCLIFAPMSDRFIDLRIVNASYLLVFLFQCIDQNIIILPGKRDQIDLFPQFDATLYHIRPNRCLAVIIGTFKIVSRQIRNSDPDPLFF